VRLAWTGAGTPLAQILEGLAASHDSRWLDATGGLPHPLDAPESDLAQILEGSDALVHLAPAAIEPDACPDDRVLEWMPRRTYLLCRACLLSGVRRMVLLSRLEVFERHDPAHRVDESWSPQPPLHPAGLAPLLAEWTAREFARAEPLEVICLRIGPQDGSGGGTRSEDVVEAVAAALRADLSGTRVRWQPFNICSGHRYVTDRARGDLLRWRPVEEDAPCLR